MLNHAGDHTSGSAAVGGCHFWRDKWSQKAAKKNMTSHCNQEGFKPRIESAVPCQLYRRCRRHGGIHSMKCVHLRVLQFSPPVWSSPLPSKRNDDRLMLPTLFQTLCILLSLTLSIGSSHSLKMPKNLGGHVSTFLKKMNQKKINGVLGIIMLKFQLHNKRMSSSIKNAARRRGDSTKRLVGSGLVHLHLNLYIYMYILYIYSNSIQCIQ